MRAMRLASGPVRENACPLRHPAHPLAKAVRPALPARRRARSALGHLAVALGAATVAALTASLPAHAQAPTRAPATVVGDWLGMLEVPGARLRIVFHIVEDEGGLTATMDSPDQGAFGIETGAVVLAGDSLTIEVPAAFGRYTGEVRGDTITGTWSQGGASLPLVLARTEGVEAPRRPQHPEPPFPYDAVDVTIPTDEPGVTLAGTLTKPHGDGPFPAVVLISGSGPQDRDETVSGHKPFLVIADALTRRGVAVLRYDDRGFGGSTGNFATATTADFANDALAAVRFLVGRDDIDPARIGLIGHSEGGIVAPMVARRSDEVAFIALLAGPGVPFEVLLPIQFERLALAAGASAEVAANMRRATRRLMEIARDTPDPNEAAAQMRETLYEMIEALPPEERQGFGTTPQMRAAAVEQQVAFFNSPWMRFLIGYDPTDDLRRLRIPVLALNGTLDLNVPPDINLPPIERALREAGNPASRVHELPGLNHLFQPAMTGHGREYVMIETTFDPSALDILVDWVVEQAARK